MLSSEKILQLAMEDPVAASEAISQLIDPALGLYKELLAKYASEFADQAREFSKFLTQLDVDAMEHYTKAGFGRDEALDLIIVRKQAALKAFNFNQK